MQHKVMRTFSTRGCHVVFACSYSGGGVHGAVVRSGLLDAISRDNHRGQIYTVGPGQATSRVSVFCTYMNLDFAE